jgi:hypothetical protein
MTNKEMTINMKEISEQLQCNLIAYLDGMPEQVIDGVCDIVVNTLKPKNSDSHE